MARLGCNFTKLEPNLRLSLGVASIGEAGESVPLDVRTDRTSVVVAVGSQLILTDVREFIASTRIRVRQDDVEATFAPEHPMELAQNSTGIVGVFERVGTDNLIKGTLAEKPQLVHVGADYGKTTAACTPRFLAGELDADNRHEPHAFQNL